MMNNLTKTWLKTNLRDVTRLAQCGVTVCKNILNARAQYNQTGDSRWLDILNTNISTYQRWTVTVEGKGALENLRKQKSKTERRGAQLNKTQRIAAAKPTQKADKQRTGKLFNKGRS
jgi:hypothetical protein